MRLHSVDEIQQRVWVWFVESHSFWLLPPKYPERNDGEGEKMVLGLKGNWFHKKQSNKIHLIGNETSI
jgi:hypothetical protein